MRGPTRTTPRTPSPPLEKLVSCKSSPSMSIISCTLLSRTRGTSPRCVETVLRLLTSSRLPPVIKVHTIDPQGEDSGVVYSEMQGRENTSGDLMSLQYVPGL